MEKQWLHHLGQRRGYRVSSFRVEIAFTVPVIRDLVDGSEDCSGEPAKAISTPVTSMSVFQHRVASPNREV